MQFASLPQSYKGRYPFTLSAPSFIYPADYVTNVKLLSPYLDEIELIFFDSASPGDLPDEALVDELAVLASDSDLTYNIHLPTDIDPGAQNAAIRQKAIDIIKYIIGLTESLEPSTYTLHLPFNAAIDSDGVSARCKRLCDSMTSLLSDGFDSRQITIENLHYPFEWADEIITAFDFSVCLDCGHLLLRGIDPESVFNQYADRITTLHIHGVANGQDHLSLDRLADSQLAGLMRILKHFSGVASVEVFSFAHLQTSLDFLAVHYDV
ncbi:cobamide remodeling phosphodiesterase CbiR [Desulfococcaceae bacterium HSG9]|nr:cobamide remodeling phosphodiesterase CbiR [Desulfococcaceae bacterium HSG9]